MKNIIKIFIVVAVIVSTVISCGDEFLELEPVSNLTEASFFRTESDANAALASVYDMLQKYGGWENEYITKLEWLPVGDMVMEESPADRAIEGLEWDAGNERFSRVWRQHYTGIARANTVIDRIGDVEAPQANKDLIEGQAKFLRGLFYFTIARYYGDAPLLTSEPTAETDFNVSRSPVSEIWAQIESDLTDAVAKLPNTWDDANLGRAKKSSALALLAKVHLYQNEWANAITRSEELINLGIHSLEPNYRDAFRQTNEHNDEDVFSVQYRDTNTGGWGEGRDGHFLAQRAAPRGVGAEFAPFGGWSNWVPATHWVEDIERDAVADTIVDQRYYGQIIGPGEKHPDIEFTMPDTVPAGFSSTGFIHTKWWFGASPNNAQYSGQNIPVFRYAEVLLNYAEALNEEGRKDDAIAAINEVRARAVLDPLPNTLTQGEVLDVIFQERRIELFWEQSFFSDLNRRGRALQFILDNRPNVADLPTDAPYLQQNPILFPIPLSEIDNNPNMTQNPGY